METESLLKVEQLAIKNTKFSNKAIFVTSPAPCSPACLSASASLLRLRQATSFIWSIPLTYPMAAITFGAAIILIAYGEGFVYGEYVLLHVRRSAQETKVAGGRQAVDI